MNGILNRVQQRALDFVTKSARAESVTSATSAFPEKCFADADLHHYKKIVNAITTDVQIDVHFHPDRIACNNLSVVDCLINDSFYHNQFVTGLSNGGLDAAMSGKRRRWESCLFGGAYDNAPDDCRPKYGALNIFNCIDGASPRFGSCYLRLETALSERCSISYGDSHSQPHASGTPCAPETLVAALAADFSESLDNSSPHLSLKALAAHLTTSDAGNSGVIGRILDDYLEVQIHGPLSLEKDVRYLSADAAFIDTPVGVKLNQLSQRYSIELRWHPGFELSANALPISFRGEQVKSFAHTIAASGKVNAPLLGTVAKSVHDDAVAWASWGSEADVQQLVKKTWHAMVAYGRVSVPPD